MCYRFLAVSLVGIAVASVHLAKAGQPRMIDEIMADTVSFATSIDAKLRQPEDKGQARAVENVLPNMVNPSEWRFHPRQGGLLVAIPVTRNLTAAEKYGGEREVIDIVERLIRQRDLSGRVEVVFIEPAALEYLRPVAQPPVCCISVPVVSQPVSACNCR